MSWLLQLLLSVDVPSGAYAAGMTWSFRGLLPLVALVVLVLAAGVGVLILYFKEKVRVNILARIGMALVRLALLGLLGFLIFRPLGCTLQFQGERPRAVVLLIDNSQSMSQRDQRYSEQDRIRVALAHNAVPLNSSVVDKNLPLPAPGEVNPRRLELVQAVLRHPDLKLQENLEKKGPVRVFTFGQGLHFAPEETRQGTKTITLDLLKADEPRTALADALNDVLLRGDGDLPAAIVVMTDGRDNASKLSVREAARECAAAGVPLHIYGVGCSNVGNIQIKDVAVPDTIFCEDTVSIPVRWRALGLKEGKATITLLLGNQPVASKDVAIREGEDFQETLTFTPAKSSASNDKQDLVAVIKIRGKEGAQDEFKRGVRVVDRKVKVLYVENSPRWEYKFLQRALLRDRRVEARFCLVNGDTEAVNSGPPYLPAFPAARKDLFAFDLLILGDVPVSYLSLEKAGWIHDFVADGGGLVVIAGRQHAPASFHGTALAEILPVEFAQVKFAIDSGARPQSFQPQLTPAGERSEMLALAETPEDNLKVWKDLPGSYWHYPVTKLRPGAVALAVHPQAKMGDEAMPLIATHHFGKGLVLFLACEETWRWRFNEQDRHFARFWGQVVYQMGLPHTLGSKRAQLYLDRPDNVQGRPGQVYARLYDSEFRPLTTERITARLERLDPGPGDERFVPIVLEAIPGQPGEYQAMLANDRVGRFAVRLENPEPSSLEYRVSLPPRHELEVSGMAEDALREAAALSGGQFYREEDLRTLIGKIEVKKAKFTEQRPLSPWCPLSFILFVGLITLEWVVRKLSNLS